MKIREIIPEKDLPIIRSWWEKHGALPVPDAFIPRGWIASYGEDDLAACFLSLEDDHKLAVVEYLTTNPAFSFSKNSLRAWKALLFHVEQFTISHHCRALLSMVAPGTSEERILKKLGYETSEDVGHRMYGKILPCQ